MVLDLNGLVQLVEETPGFSELVEQRSGRKDIAVLASARPSLMAAIYHKTKRPLLVLTAQPGRARELAEQLATWRAGDIARLPEPEMTVNLMLGVSRQTNTDLLEALAVLTGRLPQAPRIVVASAPALAGVLPGLKTYEAAWSEIRTGQTISPDALLRRWQDSGYRLEPTTETPSTMSRRGGIVDIFPATATLPVRLEFLGDTIDSLRAFDPASQRSLRRVESVAISPATLFLPQSEKLEGALARLEQSALKPEARARLDTAIGLMEAGQAPGNADIYAQLFNRDSILDYLPKDGLVILDQPENLQAAVEHFEVESREQLQQAIAGGELPVGWPEPFLDWRALSMRLLARAVIGLTSGETGSKGMPNFTPADVYAGRLGAFMARAKELHDRGQRTIIVSHQASRLAELLGEAGTQARVDSSIERPPVAGSLTLVQGILEGGWVLDKSTYLFTDNELFGFVKQHRLPKERPASRQDQFLDIKPGDYVVHVDHGVARFSSFTSMTREGVARDYLILEYAGGDRLYVPTDQVDRVTRYIGSGEAAPPILNHLGTQEWLRDRERASESAAEVARELLGIYAAREASPGYAYSPDTIWQQELEASFPYVETPDQSRAENDVKADMEAGKTMDRLVLGDVGYGKTEVAIRAAFKVVMDGKQVAVLVPTTVLAQQHLATFRQRMGAFPIKIDVLSRFRSPSEQKDVIAKLASGGIDICIGTHRLLQSDVVFKDLGLVVIDEEQRFGVEHKEHFKKLRSQVDVLTLSATPIPRTLQMSLAGVRDMSVIETPPGERLPVRTYVSAYDDKLVREAILREMERGGQVFLVHNRVRGIAQVAAKLKELVPEAQMAVGHGQMAEDELEQVMGLFAGGEVDVLVCTTIIESGLDIPNANTIIINQADRLGLTQLYQLRGRVGRSTETAYAYLLYEKGKLLTGDAEKRLKAIFEAGELGAGYALAMKDLEIRGAGSLLGLSQSGHINAVGFSLYNQLLAEAVADLRAQRAGVPAEEVKARHLPAPRLDIPLPASIPESYVADLATRLSLYQCLAGMTASEQVVQMERDFGDRFGPLPAEVQNLLYAVRLRILASRAGIESITRSDGLMVVKPLEGLLLDRGRLGTLKPGVRVGPGGVWLETARLGEKWPEALEEVVWRLAAGGER